MDIVSQRCLRFELPKQFRENDSNYTFSISHLNRALLMQEVVIKLLINQILNYSLGNLVAPLPRKSGFGFITKGLLNLIFSFHE
jgi:hypothetical protein